MYPLKSHVGFLVITGKFDWTLWNRFASQQILWYHICFVDCFNAAQYGWFTPLRCRIPTAALMDTWLLGPHPVPNPQGSVDGHVILSSIRQLLPNAPDPPPLISITSPYLNREENCPRGLRTSPLYLPYYFWFTSTSKLLPKAVGLPNFRQSLIAINKEIAPRGSGFSLLCLFSLRLPFLHIPRFVYVI